MAAAEIYDYVSTVTADVDQTLTIKPQGVVTEEGYFNQAIHLADDNSEERVSLSDGAIFYISWKWNQLTESQAQYTTFILTRPKQTGRSIPSSSNTAMGIHML